MSFENLFPDILKPPYDSVLIPTIQQGDAINGGQEITGAITSDEGISHHMVRAS